MRLMWLGVWLAGVVACKSGVDTVELRVTVPDKTPVEDTIYVQAGTALAVPMERVDDRTWTLQLDRSEAEADHAWVGDDGVLHYSYTRGHDYVGSEFLSDDPDHTNWLGRRTVRFAPDASVSDTVERWRYFPADDVTLPTLDATLGSFLPRLAGWAFQSGIQIADYYQDEQTAVLMEPTSASISALGADWVQIAPPWAVLQLDPVPIFGIDPMSPMYSEEQLAAHIANVKSHGLKVFIRLQFTTLIPDQTGRTSAWWDAWYTAFQAWYVQMAALCERTGVDMVLMSWSGSFSFPLEAGAPADAQVRWESIIAAVRGAYHGPLGLDLLSFGPLAQRGVAFYVQTQALLSRFDFLGFSLWHGLSDTAAATPTQAQLDANTEALFTDDTDQLFQLTGKPLVLTSVAYRSHTGASSSALAENDPIGLAPFTSEAVGRQVESNGLEQAMVFQAVMKAVASRPHVIGIYPFHYHWLALPLSPDYSVRGKAAERLLAQWYALIRS